MSRVVRSAVAAAALAAALGAVPPATAAGTPAIVAGPGSFVTTYAVPVVTTTVGGDMSLVNLDIQHHSVVALDATRPNGSAPWCIDYGPGKCPLFWTPLTAFGAVSAIQGLADLEPGEQYYFSCWAHPEMWGTMIVLPV